MLARFRLLESKEIPPHLRVLPWERIDAIYEAMIFGPRSEPSQSVFRTDDPNVFAVPRYRHTYHPRGLSSSEDGVAMVRFGKKYRVRVRAAQLVPEGPVRLNWMHYVESEVHPEDTGFKCNSARLAEQRVDAASDARPR